MAANQKARVGRKIGNTPGGRGPLPTGVKNQSQYYETGRGSAFGDGNVYRVLPGGKRKSMGTGTIKSTNGKS